MTMSKPKSGRDAPAPDIILSVERDPPEGDGAGQGGVHYVVLLDVSCTDKEAAHLIAHTLRGLLVKRFHVTEGKQVREC